MSKEEISSAAGMSSICCKPLYHGDRILFIYSLHLGASYCKSITTRLGVFLREMSLNPTMISVRCLVTFGAM